ncbi:unnamed protein product [Heligmosomoides polygyrus]|uniref:non-specific protein-tyrosine kinase n=1 Tax=Heligmosomoides polygyrus TaxID=6339 RepID=A0A183GUN0_HELPZ|nr:unnamed protein product [Heligmosomoides polygyrus]
MLGKYMIETTHLFDSLSDVFEYYSQKPGFLMKTMFMLLYPIRQQSWEYYHSDLQLGKILGEGAYGLVREGTLRTKSGKTVPVAIKQAKSHADLDKAKIKEMMKEARLMRLFRHKNIVRIYGVAVDEQPLLIILELVTGGALNSFLKDHGERIDTKEKISMCIGAGSGVEYLHSNECMHRDLAARNCLITKDRVVKISDFGLSRIGTQYVLKTAMKLPIKWLAPETISTFTFSLKTDVFSFGVLAYEIFANGGEPWDGLSNAEVKALVLDGKSLKFPASCPERLRDFFTHCVFAKNPAQRATMPEMGFRSFIRRQRYAIKVKISDFGLSRIGTQYVLKTAMKLPIKWLAPETISTFTFSLKTDVFSFGVLAYEIFANGGEPWDGLSNAEVKALVLDGKSLKFPASCPERLRDFFTHCVFAKNPAQRATMPEVN